MKYTEFFNILTTNRWENIETGKVYSIYWKDEDHSINLKVIGGANDGKSESHQFVQLLLNKDEQQDCHILRFQSNLFTSKFEMNSDKDPLYVTSKVFGNMILQVLN